MKRLDLYLSISKQFSGETSFCHRRIAEMFETVSVDHEMRKFEGGSYTYPKEVIGLQTDMLITYVPDLSDRVGKGTRLEVEWAIDNTIPVICITDFEVLSVQHLSGFRSDDWKYHALIEPGYVIVKNDHNVSGENDITFKRFLEMHGLTKPASGTSKRNLLL